MRPPPPTTSEEAPAEGAEVTAAVPEPGDLGPPLLAGLRSGSRASLAWVGTIDGDAFATLRDPPAPADRERMEMATPVGSEWTLFSEGVRVGSLVADSVEWAEEYCPARVVVSGVVELVPSASSAERFLGLPADEGSVRPYEAYQAFQRDYDQGVASLSLARAAIPRVGATFPPSGVLAARQDIQAFEMLGSQGQTIAATFLYQDQLAVAPPGQSAYALFLLGAPAGSSYQEDFVWYRAVDTEGKGAPRYFGHFDWDMDGEAEILLDVFGANRRWFASLARRGGQWVRTFQDSCGPGASPGG